MGRSTVFFSMILTLVMSTIPNAAFSQSRPDSRNMTCEQARTLVRSRGAIVMSTGRFTFERVVYGVGSCQYNELTKPFYAPTRDDPKCNVGRKCIQHQFNSRN